MQSVEINGSKFIKYISAEEIQTKVKNLATEIESSINLDNYTVLVMLNGAYIFAADLLRHFSQDVFTCFIKVSSYHDMLSSGNVVFDKEKLGDVEGKNFLIVEDIVDTGETLFQFINYLKETGASDIKICSLLLKPSKLVHEIKPDYLGFAISDLFVVGYGLDYNERGRGLKDIFQLEEAI